MTIIHIILTTLVPIGIPIRLCRFHLGLGAAAGFTEAGSTEAGFTEADSMAVGFTVAAASPQIS